MPYLDIVNDVLEQWIIGAYGEADPYQALLAALHPLDLPFNLPRERTRTYLSHFGKPLHEIFKIFASGARDVAMEFLGLSKEEFQIITTSTAYDRDLRAIYGLPAAPGPGALGDRSRRLLARTDARGG